MMTKQAEDESAHLATEKRLLKVMISLSKGAYQF
jgi:hypothetical protein